ncbi:SHOCT domain-containing protein [Pseudonocardia sp.]|uniref:SHOCT domain-containing protein n=1 Tax=Pseudonocardia sp. TaxID=60912 RepID=UPI002616E05F|nr:SHOCT domain-containing protein [Pseudonocardia sp.]
MRRGMRRARRGPGLLGTVARTAVVAGTASAVAGGVSSAQQASAQQRRQGLDAQAQLAEAQRRAEVDAQVAAALATQAATPPPPADDVLDRLTRLGELRAAGVLTDEEFATQKARILGT